MSDINTASNKEKPGLDTYHSGWVSYFLAIHVVGAVGMVYGVFGAAWATIVFTIVYYFLCHLAITIGAHRLCAHRTFRTTKPFQYVLVLLFSGVMQGPITWWAGKHRLHHEKSDVRGEDPHTPEDGFLHAHIFWQLKRRGLAPPPTRHVLAFGRPEFSPAMWQTRRYMVLGILMAFVVPTAFCALWSDWLGGLLVGGFARLLFQYHLTWIVNSIGHTWGEHHGGGSTNQRGLLGQFLAIMTVGESNHASHHDAPLSYRIGRDPGQIDPGARVLEILAWLGIVSELKTK